ncbi:MAG: hypothetical protein ABIP93_21530 [Gemmatimonadaceae bacterium]
MRTASRAMLALVLALAGPSMSTAQATAHPSLAGSWVLDPAQSDQGQQMMPTKLNLTITQSAKELVVMRAQTTQMGESNATLKYALDGTTSVNEIPMGGNAVKISTVVSWEGETTVFKNTLDIQGNEVQQMDKWTLADGGKKLLVVRNINFGGQETTFKLTLVKQP